MFSKFLKRKPPTRAPQNPAVPEGVIVWAVGDVHGRLDLLKPLVKAIAEDASSAVADRKVVVFLGDYVDRGPESRGVVQYLASLTSDAGIEWRFLKGNHEETMLDFLDDPSVGPQWCEYGGDATLVSYGLRVSGLKHRPETWRHLSADLDHKLTPIERAFLQSLESSITIGDYFFCHAGARPGVALDAQSDEDLLWIRRTFLDSDCPFDRVVVHGHTPTADVHYDYRRLGVDTKAYASDRLTAVRIEAENLNYMQTRRSDEGLIDVTVRRALGQISASAA